MNRLEGKLMDGDSNVYTKVVRTVVPITMSSSYEVFLI